KEIKTKLILHNLTKAGQAIIIVLIWRNSTKPEKDFLLGYCRPTVRMIFNQDLVLKSSQKYHMVKDSQGSERN
uniref:hypothetical protein n=1 Tax=Methanoculleus sp. TaxID=90427 RepID=UPI00272EE587